jgi:3-deoxy-D-manno-octulosonic-acid transferase
METELWPNLIARAARDGVPVLLVNARLSERSATGYRRLGGLTRSMLGRLDLIACQYPDHAGRFRSLGAPAERLHVLGSVKFDVALPEDARERVDTLRARWGLQHQQVWIAGSTHPGEEALILDAHAALRSRVPGVRLILVPRHPSRCGEVAALCRVRGFRVARQSDPAARDTGSDVILGDVMGQLLYLYGLSDVAFLGGSLVEEVGGHNPIEPALWGQPLLMGPHTFNFPDVVARFVEAGALTVVSDVGMLAAALAATLQDGPAAAAASAAAQRVVAENRGASERLLTLLAAQIDGSIA